MKVKDVIQLLSTKYDPEQELMIRWWGSEAFEMEAGAWTKAVRIFDAERYTPSDYKDYICAIITDAEAIVEDEEIEKRHAELAMDSYLERIREEQAGV